MKEVLTRLSDKSAEQSSEFGAEMLWNSKGKVLGYLCLSVPSLGLGRRVCMHNRDQRPFHIITERLFLRAIIPAIEFWILRWVKSLFDIPQLAKLDVLDVCHVVAFNRHCQNFVGPRTLKAKTYAPVDQQLVRYPLLTSVVHLLPIPPHIASIWELFLCAFDAKGLHNPDESIHALFHIILAIKVSHFRSDISGMNSQCYDVWSNFFQVLGLSLGEVVQSAFGKPVADVAANVVYCR